MHQETSFKDTTDMDLFQLEWYNWISLSSNSLCNWQVGLVSYVDSEYSALVNESVNDSIV